MPGPTRQLPERVHALIEVPKGGFVKRELHLEGEPGRLSWLLGPGRVDYISPLPCPFNYGCAPELPALDGDPADVVVLGPRRPSGSRVDLPVLGVVRFWDAGRPDDKLVASDGPITPSQRRGVETFFRLYAFARAALNLARGLSGRTEYLGYVPRESLEQRPSDSG